jgi:hypothetical protein
VAGQRPQAEGHRAKPDDGIQGVRVGEVHG